MHRYAVTRRLRAVVLIFTVAVLTGCLGEGSGPERIPGTPPPPIAGPDDEAEFELIFSDEFNEGSAPDPAKWSYDLGYGDNGWGNNEWQLYTDSPDNVRVEDGNLVIQARCDSPPCGVRDGTVTSARIKTQDKFEFRFGKIEARIKPPVGAGAWPAFWALGANFPEIGWPRSGEIDFMEIFNTGSDEFTTHATLHWCDENLVPANQPCFPAGRIFRGGEDTLDESLGDDFHIFEMIWDFNRVIARIDNRPYFLELDIDPINMEEFLREFFMILNVGMGGTLGSGGQAPNGSETFPQTMLVDYIRVYQVIGEDGFLIDFEDPPETYNFQEFEGGPVIVLPNPVPEGINVSAQVARMQKFMAASGATFGGSVLTLPIPLTLDAGSMFTMKVWSQRPVNVLFKLEGTGQIEQDLPHSGSGWEEITYDFSSFEGTAERLVFIFDNGTNGDAANDEEFWTFYFDDITLIPPEMVVDETPPTLTSVSIASSNVDPTVAGTGDIVTVSVVADEPIFMPNVTIAGMLADTVMGADASWEASLQLNEGTDGLITFTVDYTDLAGNSGNTISTTTDGSLVVFDSSELSVTILGAPESFSTLDPFSITIEFTEFVLGFDVSEIDVGNGSANGLTITGDTTYTSSIIPDGGDGDLTIDVAAGVVMDLAGNLNQAAPTVTVLNNLGASMPELTAVSIESGNANAEYAQTGDVITLSMTANGAINTPSVTIVGQPADDVTGADDSWQATYTMRETDSEGEVGFFIDFTDIGGTAGPQTTMTTDGSSVTFDRTPPGLSIDGVPATISTLDPIPVTFRFDEAVTGFEDSDIIVVNGTRDSFAVVDLSTYTVNVTPNGLGNLTVAVAAGRATDLAGNANTSAVASATLTSR